jgi:mono/diheme cytochrome c family protein
LKRIIGGLALIAVLGLVAFWVLSMPRPIAEAALPKHAANVENGQLIYNIGGCHSCHKPAAEGADAALPSGGTPLKTPVGTLYPPNITPDTDTGIGAWSDIQFVNAMQRGIAPDGSHLIPAFPYTSYARMNVADVLDLKAYLMSLKPVNVKSRPHELLAEPLVRRGIGLWKWAGLDTTPWTTNPNQSAEWNLGSYLVNAPGHCGECHTPRNIFMASNMGAYLAGGPHPDGQGKVPSLHGLIERSRYKDKADLVLAFQNGELLGYDKMSSGGMGAVQTNISKLPQSHVEAIAEFVTSLK